MAHTLVLDLKSLRERDASGYVSRVISKTPEQTLTHTSMGYEKVLQHLILKRWIQKDLLLYNTRTQLDLMPENGTAAVAVPICTLGNTKPVAFLNRDWARIR